MFLITEDQRKALLQLPADEESSQELFTKAFGGKDAISKIRTTFEEEGYVLVRGLLDDDLITNFEDQAQTTVNEAAAAAKKTAKNSFTAMQFGGLFSDPPASNEQEQEESKQYFRKVALKSAVPQFIARVLLGLDASKSQKPSLRVLKDAFLAKGTEEGSCGWHVDDTVFWPTIAVDPSPGVNAWIALDDIPASLGGGMAISPRSHKADWRHQAYNVIGSTQVFPKGGFKTVKEMADKLPNSFQTCSMAENGFELHAQIEATKILPDYTKGDVLFCTRWLFHRSVLPTEKGLEHLNEMAKSNPDRIPVFKRYTIRYEPGTARCIEGCSLIEPSILVEPSNVGKTLDEVCAETGPWYPRCWPNIDENEMKDMKQLVDEKFPIADAIKSEKFKEIGPYFAKKKES